MAEKSDPYSVLLGIAPKPQPMNFYRLLGIELFESDQEVIETAAKRQRAKLRQAESGRHRSHAQKLLKQVEAARRCLISEVSRSEYDNKLKARLGKASTTSSKQQPSQQAKQAKRKSAWWMVWVSGGVGLGVVCVAAFFLVPQLMAPTDEPALAQNDQPAEATDVNPPSEAPSITLDDDNVVTAKTDDVASEQPSDMQALPPSDVTFDAIVDDANQSASQPIDPPDSSPAMVRTESELEIPTVETAAMPLTRVEMFNSVVSPFFEKNCNRCHGPKREEGGLRIDQLTTNFDDLESVNHYQNILDEMTVGQMPPEDEPRPNNKELLKVCEILTDYIAAVREKHESGGGRVTRRLTRSEFVNTIADLMGVQVDPTELPEDGVSGGFDTNAAELSTTDMHFELYLEVARQAVQNFIAGGDKSSQFFARWRNDKNISNGDALAIIKKFTELVSRGQDLDPEFIKALGSVYQQGTKLGASPQEAMVEPMAIALCSIESLFHLEDKGSSNNSVTGIELANRLSYFLWRSAPDDQLLTLAKSGQLLDAEVKAQQIERMMADQKFNRFINDFTVQWLELSRQDEISIDERIYKEFPQTIRTPMKQETIQFVGHLIRKDLPLQNLIDSDFMMLNNQMAEHYGIPDVKGPEFRPVERRKADHKRGGILTQAGILMQTGTGDRTSIVERGAFVSRKLLNYDPPPPPPNVDPLPTNDPMLAQMTAAQLTLHHLSVPQCAACHKNLDPLGTGLEEFDAIGQLRSVERRLNPVKLSLKKRRQLIRRKRPLPPPFIKVPIETHGVLPSGQRYTGLAGLKKALLTQEKKTVEGFIEALLTYTNGRKAGIADRGIVEAVMAETQNRDYSAGSVLRELLLSDAMSAK